MVAAGGAQRLRLRAGGEHVRLIPRTPLRAGEFARLVLGVSPPSGGRRWRLALSGLQPAVVGAVRRAVSTLDAAAYAGPCVISKFAEFVGLLKFYRTQFRGTPLQLIEHR